MRNYSNTEMPQLKFTIELPAWAAAEIQASTFDELSSREEVVAKAVAEAVSNSPIIILGPYNVIQDPHTNKVIRIEKDDEPESSNSTSCPVMGHWWSTWLTRRLT
jgi:hypothetical protein